MTGYAVSSLVYLYSRTGDENALGAAQRAGNFLISEAWDPDLGIFPFEHPANGEAGEPLAYFFDCGIIVRGLLALFRATADARYLDAAVRGGSAMQRFVHAGDQIHPILRLPSFDPQPYTTQWSRSPGCYQLKSAMAWRDLAVETGDTRFMDWYERTVASALATHRGFLPAESPEKTMDRLHAYSYFLEALIPVSDRTNVAPVLRDGITLVSGYLSGIRPQFERSDVNAQLLRVRLFAEQRAGIPLHRADAEREASAIPLFHLTDQSDARLNGGYCFGRRGDALIPHENPVSTAFCSQALEMWRDYQSGQRLAFDSLV
jgi:hypothetical protein